MSVNISEFTLWVKMVWNKRGGRVTVRVAEFRAMVDGYVIWLHADWCQEGWVLDFTGGGGGGFRTKRGGVTLPK